MESDAKKRRTGGKNGKNKRKIYGRFQHAAGKEIENLERILMETTEDGNGRRPTISSDGSDLLVTVEDEIVVRYRRSLPTTHSCCGSVRSGFLI